MLEAANAVRQSRRAIPLADEQYVFVVDDDAAVRESFDALLTPAGWQVSTFASGSDFLSHPRPCAASCLVLDIGTSNRDGLDIQQRLASMGAVIPIVCIAAYIDVPTTVRAMKGGAVDLLVKPLQEVTLIGAIEHALARSAASLRSERELALTRERHASLTRREAQVMALVVAGRLNKQVAGDLGISEITVKAHRGKLMRKMMARTLPDLVRMAMRLEIP